MKRTTKAKVNWDGNGNYLTGRRSGPDEDNIVSCSTQLNMKFILLINVKMPTIVGILTNISRINIKCVLKQ